MYVFSIVVIQTHATTLQPIKDTQSTHTHTLTFFHSLSLSDPSLVVWSKSGSTAARPFLLTNSRLLYI